MTNEEAAAAVLERFPVPEVHLSDRELPYVVFGHLGSWICGRLARPNWKIIGHHPPPDETTVAAIFQFMEALPLGEKSIRDLVSYGFLEVISREDAESVRQFIGPLCWYLYERMDAGWTGRQREFDATHPSLFD